jgi:hypothetical protein
MYTANTPHPTKDRLLGLGSLLGRLGLSPLLLRTLVPLSGASEAKGAESLDLPLLLGDGARRLGLIAGRDGGELAGDVGGEVVTL